MRMYLPTKFQVPGIILTSFRIPKGVYLRTKFQVPNIILTSFRTPKKITLFRVICTFLILIQQFFL